MAVANSPLTVAEFEMLPARPDGGRMELHHGELFEQRPPFFLHTKLQRIFVRLLEELLHNSYLVVSEFPFQPVPEYDWRIADVAVVERSRWESAPLRGYFAGVPTIVIEVLSPSNSAAEMLDRQQVCLSNGGREFWQVDPERQTVTVVTAGGAVRHYGRGDEVALDSAIASGPLVCARVFDAVKPAV